ncbi:hypothetical protein Q4F19_04985 [Sphingomonas sp. BIUV-7]|uniref:Type IV toxin-antitoxin system AbiEi family antitoxin domain-containing protein n=1 Tax=Sphingomonas natans TaxID=3063330 RepID=A0ABT8Y7Q5_9SPHN|nr:hypothetical protein [Sphingomonas sp. BIUV-7]MDO6413730.1 hypothetical protein [Sphingomonas sp. BIUV-7]
MRIWTEAVTRAIHRHVARTGSPLFTRRALINAEVGAIIDETRTAGSTPTQTLGRELQQLRDAGLLEFLDRGTYRWLGPMPDVEPAMPSKGVFLLPPRHRSGDLPERSFAFPLEWLGTAARTVDQWILYQDRGGYQAAARVQRIEPDRDRPHVHRAQIGSEAMWCSVALCHFIATANSSSADCSDRTAGSTALERRSRFARSRTPTSTISFNSA